MKELKKNTEDLKAVNEALKTVEEVTARLISAAEAIAKLKELNEQLKDKPGAV